MFIHFYKKIQRVPLVVFRNLNLYLSTITIGIILALVFASCGEKYFYEKTYELADNQWSYSDTLHFDVDILDTLKTYHLILDIEHSVEYPYQNNYIYIHTHLPNGEHLGKQVSIDLAEKSGKWNGDCNSETCELRTFIQPNAYFNQVGKHRFSVEQYMRTDSLPDIRSVSLRIQETGMTR